MKIYRCVVSMTCDFFPYCFNHISNHVHYSYGCKRIGYRRILLILYLFSHFLSDSDSNMDRLIYKCEYGLLLLQIRIDMCQIRSEPDADNVEHGCFFRYRVKATFIHITYVVNSNTIWVQILNRLYLTKQINKQLQVISNLSHR